MKTLIRTRVVQALPSMLSRWRHGTDLTMPLTPVSSMRGFWGLMRAYWFSERWREAWALTAAITLLTAANSKALVWFAEASGDLISAIAFFHHPDTKAPLQSVLTSAATLVLLVIAKDAGLTGVRNLFSTTLHRKWRSWLDGRFNHALLDGNHTHHHLQHGGRDANGAPVPAPDNVDQRVQESIKGMTGGAIGLAMGVLGVTTTLFFVGQKLIETSTEVSGLAFLGSYGAAFLAFAAVAVYVPLNTWLALKLGRVLEKLTIAMQRAEGSYRGELTSFLRRSFHVSASRGESVQRDIHKGLYKDIDHTWGRLNWIQSGYMSFELIYNFIAARVVAYGPGLMPYAQGQISLKNYVVGAEMVNALISQCSWFIHVMPEIASLRANARRVTELAEAIEKVQQPADFYRATGRSDFRFTRQHANLGLIVRNLELTHAGDALPFVSAPILRFRRGEWTFLKGESGCGKTSMIKAINGLWPHGGADIALPEGVRPFYAAQDVKLPRVTLKQLVCLPHVEADHEDRDAATALHKAGLGEFIEWLAETGREGKSWDESLSGGQKQKLVLARVLLHRPGLLFLDEATGALDVEAKTFFHQAIKDNCPGVTVISVMHEAEPPKSALGADFYDSVVQFSDGVATKMLLRTRRPPELTTILGQPVKEVAARAPRVRQKQKLD